MFGTCLVLYILFLLFVSIFIINAADAPLFLQFNI